MNLMTEMARRLREISEASLHGVMYDEVQAMARSLEMITAVYQDIPEHDPTKEEARILEKFDSAIFELLGDYADKGVRAEVLIAAAHEDVDAWFDYQTEGFDDDADD